MSTDFRTNLLMQILLTASAGLWIDLLRQGLMHGWSWPLQPRRNVPWQTFEAVATMMIVLLCVSATLGQIFELARADGTVESVAVRVRNLRISCLSQVLQLMLIPLILSLWCRCRWEDFGLRRQGLLTDLRFAVWGLLLAFLPVYLAEYPLREWRSESPHDMLELLRDSGADWQTLTWIALEVTILAPLVEELLFRVLLQGSLEREVHAAWAILLTALAFVTTHKRPDWIPLLPLALILGYVYYRRHSMLAVVVLHGLFNGISLLCAVWSLNGNS